MSTATANAGAPAKGKKKLLIIIVAAVAVLLLAAGGALLMMKKSASAEDGEDAEAEHAPAKTAAKHDPKAAPTFVPLEPFTVNLAVRDTERYAQVGITLEVSDAKVGDQIKAYMPAIRNNVLMVLADKTAVELMDRQGKAKLADQVRRETSRAMGYEVGEPDNADAEAEDEPKPKKKKKRAPAPELPVTGVHFSNFIIQ